MGLLVKEREDGGQDTEDAFQVVHEREGNAEGGQPCKQEKQGDERGKIFPLPSSLPENGGRLFCPKTYAPTQRTCLTLKSSPHNSTFD
jgi:hypothetical protein